MKVIDWIQLTQNMVQWREFVNIAMNHRSHKNGKALDQLSDCHLLIRQCCMQLV